MPKRDVIKGFGHIAALSALIAIGLNVILLTLDLARFSLKYQSAAESLYSMSVMELIFYSGIAMPILEELLFRALIFRLLRKKTSFWLAAVISSVLFGIYHGNLVQFVYASLCGMFFAYVCEKGLSVLFSVWSHIIMNLTASMLTITGILSFLMQNPLSVAITILICVTVGWLLFQNFRKLDVTKLLNSY